MRARYVILFIAAVVILLAVFVWSFTWDDDSQAETGTLVYERMWNNYGRNQRDSG